MKAYQLKKPDLNTIQVHEWHDVEDSKAIVCIVHGMGEHSRRYDHVAKYLNNNRFRVTSYDQKGHGESYGKRGHVDSINNYLDDLDFVLNHIKSTHPASKIILYGHSMGGSVVANYLIHRNQSFSAAVITSPLLKLAFEPPRSKVFLAKTMSKIYGGYSENTKLEVSHISKDQQVVDAYMSDPLVHSKMTASTFMSLIEHGQHAIAQAANIKIPTLLFHGEEDKITSHSASIEFSEKSDFIHFKSWPGLYHETHNEPEKDEVLGYLVNWLNKTLEF